MQDAHGLRFELVRHLGQAGGAHLRRELEQHRRIALVAERARGELGEVRGDPRLQHRHRPEVGRRCLQDGGSSKLVELGGLLGVAVRAQPGGRSRERLGRAARLLGLDELRDVGRERRHRVPPRRYFGVAHLDRAHRVAGRVQVTHAPERARRLVGAGVPLVGSHAKEELRVGGAIERGTRLRSDVFVAVERELAHLGHGLFEGLPSGRADPLHGGICLRDHVLRGFVGDGCAGRAEPDQQSARNVNRGHARQSALSELGALLEALIRRRQRGERVHKLRAGLHGRGICVFQLRIQHVSERQPEKLRRRRLRVLRIHAACHLRDVQRTHGRARRADGQTPARERAEVGWRLRPVLDAPPLVGPHRRRQALVAEVVQVRRSRRGWAWAWAWCWWLGAASACAQREECNGSEGEREYGQGHGVRFPFRGFSRGLLWIRRRGAR